MAVSTAQQKTWCSTGSTGRWENRSVMVPGPRDDLSKKVRRDSAGESTADFGVHLNPRFHSTSSFPRLARVTGRPGPCKGSGVVWSRRCVDVEVMEPLHRKARELHFDVPGSRASTTFSSSQPDKVTTRQPSLAVGLWVGRCWQATTPRPGRGWESAWRSRSRRRWRLFLFRSRTSSSRWHRIEWLTMQCSTLTVD